MTERKIYIFTVIICIVALLVILIFYDPVIVSEIMTGGR